MSLDLKSIGYSIGNFFCFTSCRSANHLRLESYEKINSELLLPDEILIHIFSFLDVKTLAATVSLICKLWCRVSLDQSLWKAHFENQNRNLSVKTYKNFLPEDPGTKINYKTRYKTIFISTHEMEKWQKLENWYDMMTISKKLKHGEFYTLICLKENYSYIYIIVNDGPKGKAIQAKSFTEWKQKKQELIDKKYKEIRTLP